MLRALPLVLAQLADRRILAVLARSLAISLCLFAALWLWLARALRGVDLCGLADLRSCALDTMAAGLLATLGTLIALWFLFPPVAIAVVNLFADTVVDAVEARHYPDRAALRRPGWGDVLALSLASAGRFLLWNLLALPLYLLLIVTGVGPFLLFLGLNGVLLGRDLGEMVALRHLDRSHRALWLDASRGRRALMGLLVAALFLLPVVNLLAPVIGAALATHLFHRSRRP